jgi:hypothetical protein
VFLCAWAILETVPDAGAHPDARQRQVRGARLALMFGILPGAGLVAIGIATGVLGVRG